MIGIINGSPKAGENTSGMLIEALLPLLGEQDTVLFRVKDSQTSEQVEQICQCDALLFVFPLYADSFPSHMLRLLTALESHGFPSTNTKVYCLVNNGFYEGSQNAIVLEQMRAFTEAAGLCWGMGVGVGSGELHRALRKIPLGKGPNKNLGRALTLLAKNILQRTAAQDLYVLPNCPRFVWNWLAKTFMWHAVAKKNGLSKKELYRKIETDEIE